MKIILFVLTIITLDTFIYINCQDESLMNNPILRKRYPKKHKSVQIINSRKFLKVSPDEIEKRKQRKGNLKHEGYTYFPAIVSNQGSPDGPFFQPELYIEPKVRVKKVLPEYPFTLSRGKRSVKNNNIGNNKNITRKRNKGYKRQGKNIKKAGVRVANPKTKKAHHHKKLKSTAKAVRTLSSRLRHGLKGSKHKNRLRRGKRNQKQQLRNKRTQKGHQNTNKNVKRKGRQQRKPDMRRLIAGKDAMIADYPYVVSIQKGDEHWCAGALLNQRIVITTANCIWKSDRISRLRIRASSRHADRGGQLARIQEVLKHPKWSIRKNPDNDVALILLDRNIKFSDKVHSVDLPNHSMMPAFEDAWVTSWGAERRDGIFENTQFTLQVYHTRLMNHEKCNNVTKRFGVRVTENFICLTQTGRRAPCTRDTGAPAVSDGILWGLASWGLRKRCGTERFPAMFSYMASPSNLEFIVNATHYLMSDKRHYPFPDRFEVQRASTVLITTPSTD